MVDLSQTIIPKSDQLNADDLIGGPITITVTKVSRMGSPDQPIAINYEGDNGKPYKPCKGMRRVMVQVWGKDGNAYVGRSMTLYNDPKVKFGGADVGGIRISHMSHISEKITLAVTVSKARRKPFVVMPLKTSTQKKIDPAVKKAGENAAANGVDAYTNWLSSLEPDVKETVRPYHAELTKKAKAVEPPVEEAPIDDTVEEDDDIPQM